ncbi:MAG: acetaldehyde dehydrogenase/alcohol dehydrogenase [Parasphingorhabdus sp.]|jgi:acetaldehyde dehydrogenase/alcohol dehydrogenase
MTDFNTMPRMLTPDATITRAGQMLNTAKWAASRYAKMDAAAVHNISEAVANAAFLRSREYAEWAVKESGYGRVEHKVKKNEACSKGIFERYGSIDYVSPRIDRDLKIVELPRPAGVVLALTPVTNPIATLYFKTLLALMTRNAIILCPHPGSKAVCSDAACTLAAAAVSAGAPPGLILVVDEPTLPLIDIFMTSEVVDLIVATGGPAVVKAAYQSGNPAIGVGSGNAPVLVDDTADLRKTARRIVESKAFDNSILCTNESTVLAFEQIADELLNQLKIAKAHICSPEEVQKLRSLLYSNGAFNSDMIGKDASRIAQAAGFRAEGAEILLAQVDLIQPEEVLIREKLCPVLAFGRVKDLDEAMAAARSVMRNSGKGHSAVVHSKSERNVLAFADAVPALRICVNVGLSLGASGFDTNLGPSMTIGTGFAGGSSVGDNLTPQNFINMARIAYNKSDSEVFGNYEGLCRKTIQPQQPLSSITAAQPSAGAGEIRDELRRLIQEELKALLAA